MLSLKTPAAHLCTFDSSAERASLIFSKFMIIFFMPSSDSELDESPNRVTIMNYDTVITIEPQKIEAYEPNVEGTKICIGEGRGIVVFEPFEEVRQSITKLFSCQ